MSQCLKCLIIWSLWTNTSHPKIERSFLPVLCLSAHFISFHGIVSAQRTNFTVNTLMLLMHFTMEQSSGGCCSRVLISQEHKRYLLSEIFACGGAVILLNGWLQYWKLWYPNEQRSGPFENLDRTIYLVFLCIFTPGNKVPGPSLSAFKSISTMVVWVKIFSVMIQNYLFQWIHFKTRTKVIYMYSLRM